MAQNRPRSAMRIQWLACTLLVVVTLFSARAGADAPRVAIISDGASDIFVQEPALLAQEVRALLGNRFEGFEFPAAPTHVGDFTAERATELVDEALANREIDMVIGYGIHTARAIGRVERLTKPVFLPSASPQLHRLPQDEGTSGRRNLAYLIRPFDLNRDIAQFRAVVRSEHPVLILDSYFAQALEQLPTSVELEGGGSVRILPVAGNVEAIMAAIPADADAVYIGPLFQLPQSAEQGLIDALNGRRLPTYAGGGRAWVDRGAFVTLIPADENQRRARRMALNISEALDGEEPSRFSTLFQQRPELVINMATARTIGVSPSFELMVEATLVGQETNAARGRELDLPTVVREALAANLGLGVARRDADIARQQVEQTRGGWLPTVDANADFTWLDPDAANNLGNAERQLSWGISAQQVIYSPALHQGIRATLANERAVQHGIQSRELDVISDASTAYLNVLRARTAERVNRDNLQRIRRNLALAEVRVSIGSANRSEGLRWQIELADGRAAIIQASAQRNQAEIALNRVLNRDDLEEPFRPVEPETPEQASELDPAVVRYLEDPRSFRILRTFVAQEAVRNSPEIRQIDASLEALEHQITGLRRALYIPDVFVSGGLNHVFHRSGAGSADDTGIPGVQRDNFTWQVGAGLRFRLFDAARYPEISGNEAQIGQLETQRREIAQQIEQGVLAAMHQAASSRAAMRLRQDAANAANQNLELVVDAYQRGATTIITLIDAQSQALLTELSAANAIYDFLVDFVRVERSTGQFGFRRTEAERVDFRQRLTTYAAEQRQERD
ncbi:MAG: TolC family protein [Polyangiales bacterium]